MTCPTTAHNAVYLLAVVVPAALLAAWLLRRVAAGDVARRLRPAWLSGVAAHSAVVFVTCAAAVLTFAAIAEEVGEGETAPFDVGVRAWTLGHHAAGVTRVFGAFTWMRSTSVIAPAAVLAALWLWRVRGARVAATTAAPLVALALVGALKVAFRRTRPLGAFHDPRLANALRYSFPSGHATASAATACTLAYVVARERLAPRWLSIAAAVLFPLLVGLSRVYLDVHWASDVVGGWAVDLAVASGAVALYERTRPTAGTTSA